MEELRNIIKEFKVTEFSLENQIEFAEICMKDNISESKLIAILIHEALIGKLDTNKQLDIINSYFEQEYIFDWNICDWLCVKVLTKILNTDSQKIIPVLQNWSVKDYLWHARASLVPFAQCEEQIEYKKEIFLLSERLIKREERFCKTAAGWVMREWNKQYDSKEVIQFFQENAEFATMEVFNNAFKNFDKDRKKRIKESVFEKKAK